MSDDSPASAGSLGRLRVANRRTLLQLLASGPASRADLARSSQLSRSTVSSIVAELLDTGQVVEAADRGAPHKGGGGRPPVLVRLATPPGAVVGVDIGHRHVRVAVADRAGVVLAEDRSPADVDSAGAPTLDTTADMVRRACGRAGVEVARLGAVAMCVPAPIDRRSARIRTGILPGWRDLAPAEELARRLGSPVVAENDANLGALAEVHHGAARGMQDVVYVKVASGLGAGLVLGGRLHRGSAGLAGEIGHVQIGEDGEVCRCGNRGCLETRVAAPRLIELLQPAYDEVLSTDRVLELARAGDAGVRRVLSDAGRTIGRALADLCNSLNPAAVVVGGSFGPAAPMVDGIREAIDRYAQPHTARAVGVLPGDLGDRAELVGAVTLANARVAAD